MENQQELQRVVLDQKFRQLLIIFPEELMQSLKGDCPNCGQPLNGSHCDTCGG